MAWLDRWRHPIFFGALLVIIAGVYLASHLQLRSDLSSLLPPSKRSVEDLAKLQKRARSFGDVIVAVDAPDPATRAAAAGELIAKLRAMDPALVATVSTDDHAAARYGWEHRFLFATLDDLQAADTAFADKLTKARLKGNPGWVDLGDPDADATKASDDKVDALQKRLDDAEKEANAPPMRVSEDGKAQLVIATVTFPSSDVGKGRVVMAQVHAIADAIAAAHPGTEIKIAGSINISIFEHDSVIAGMALSAIITVALVMIALFWYYRTALSVLGGLYALMTGVLFTLGFTQVAIGHLNLLSAFLTAIVVGNGINAGLIVLSRFGEELRRGTKPADAVGPALSSSLHGTLAASLTAAVAYAALIVTDFRGFRHFGIIGGVGMAACWLTTYSVLPVTLLWLARRNLIKVRKPPAIGTLLAKLAPAPDRVGRALAGGALVVVAAIAITARFLIDDPFQKDWRDLQADGGEIAKQHVVDQWLLHRFSSGKLALAKPVVQARDRRRRSPRPGPPDGEAPPRPRGRQAPEGTGAVHGDHVEIDDLIPEEPGQEARGAREDQEAVRRPDHRSDPRRARAARACCASSRRTSICRRSPARPTSPTRLKRLFIEQDGSVGRLIYVKGSPRFQTWNVDDRVVFANLVHDLPLPPGVVIGGEPLVIADIVDSMKRDAPIMVVVSLLGSILVVWFVVGYRRHGTITLICGMCRRRRDDRGVRDRGPQGPLPRSDRAADHDRHRHRLRGQPDGARPRRRWHRPAGTAAVDHGRRGAPVLVHDDGRLRVAAALGERRRSRVRARRDPRRARVHHDGACPRACAACTLAAARFASARCAC